ncbi:YegS/Rv2252/BmrU family lipid kinase [Mobilisporobacter senegalensis]|uniref:YegS/Rv2252/BmrU family lipid kinase n=1 Tax=Mobilisporobacter senegalensis TaxID=1329262 RepID=A0A3N1XM08_9FIRM|nr:YegS/Rv2252/BmrU family lipid kinase [Mobilisporobacter senegalensis]ROR27171.1 YegS/Rv2252/BmrU family lipid kinase [Mobilisporobacter senegalensis]
MKKKMLFVYNPNAGKGKIKTRLSDIVEIFVKADYEVTIYATRGKQDATRIVKNSAKEYDLIVCSGGDGTLNEVTAGVMTLEKRPEIGYLPAGTTNDFAASHKIPKNILRAAEVAVNGEPYYYDVGSVNDEFFAYVAAFGAFTEVSYETPQTIKNTLGRVAYLLEGMKRLPSLKSYKMIVKYDDKVIEEEFIFGMITNSSSVGGFKGFIGKEILLDDGLFEICLIKVPKNPIELQAIINTLITKDTSTNLIYSFRTNRMSIEAKEEVPWTLDGEFGGNFSQVDIKIYKQAIAYRIEPKKALISTKNTEVKAALIDNKMKM